MNNIIIEAKMDAFIESKKTNIERLKRSINEDNESIESLRERIKETENDILFLESLIKSLGGSVEPC